MFSRGQEVWSGFIPEEDGIQIEGCAFLQTTVGTNANPCFQGSAHRSATYILRSGRCHIYVLTLVDKSGKRMSARFTKE